MNNIRIAVPSNGEGGLNGTRSEHFGHCDVFTLIDVENGIVKKETVLNNEGHEHGGCMVPVNLLANNDVNAVVVAGIGRRPLTGFNNVGIDVYIDTVNPIVITVINKLINDNLVKMSLDEACGGTGNCQ
ncbi:NifB/NifX family molybdenum-iron cluster-binding protein [Candidatus Neomarinimicrobiota bacterium]